MKQNMLAVGLTLLALLALLVAALLVAGLWVAPRAHADQTQDNVYSDIATEATCHMQMPAAAPWGRQPGGLG
jgi:hypothetical protein